MSVGGVWFAVDADGVVGRFETERVSDDTVPSLGEALVVFEDDPEPREPARGWVRFEEEGRGVYAAVSDGGATLDDLPPELAARVAAVRFPVRFAEVEEVSLRDLPGARLAPARSGVPGLGEWCLKRLDWLGVAPGSVRGREEAFVRAMGEAYAALPPALQVVLRHRFAADSTKSLVPAAAELGVDRPAAMALWAEALAELGRAAQAHVRRG